MIVSLDMTLVAVLALILGIASFFAPRFLGLVVAAGLVLFGVFTLFPDVMDTDLRETVSSIQLDDFRIGGDTPASTAAESAPPSGAS